jgi:hypothetical protein
MKLKVFAKKYLFGVLLILVIFPGVLFYLSACKKDPCKDIVCQNGGTSAASGKNCTCSCLAGFEGDLCQIRTRDKLIGSYSTNLCAGVISSSASFADRVNFSLSGITFYGTVNGNNITIVSQSMGSDCGGTATCSGSGTINSTSSNLQITLTLAITGTLNCCLTTPNTITFTWTKL